MNDSTTPPTVSDRRERTVRALRITLLYIGLLALLVLARPQTEMLIVGGVLMLAGEAVRFWAAGYLLKTRELMTDGPYAFVRNPLYLGRLLIITGFCLAASLPAYANLAGLAVFWLVFFAYYMPRKERVEPDRLLTQHGETYAAYARDVRSLWPRLTPWPGRVPAEWQWARVRRNRELLMVIGIAAAIAWLAWRLPS